MKNVGKKARNFIRPASTHDMRIHLKKVDINKEIFIKPLSRR